MVEEKVVTEWKVREISFHPSIANWQGLVNPVSLCPDFEVLASCRDGVVGESRIQPVQIPSPYME